MPGVAERGLEKFDLSLQANQQLDFYSNTLNRFVRSCSTRRTWLNSILRFLKIRLRLIRRRCRSCAAQFSFSLTVPVGPPLLALRPVSTQVAHVTGWSPVSPLSTLPLRANGQPFCTLATLTAEGNSEASTVSRATRRLSPILRCIRSPLAHTRPLSLHHDSHQPAMGCTSSQPVRHKQRTPTSTHAAVAHAS